jgi:hypothetical protein
VLINSQPLSFAVNSSKVGIEERGGFHTTVREVAILTVEYSGTNPPTKLALIPRCDRTTEFVDISY